MCIYSYYMINAFSGFTKLSSVIQSFLILAGPFIIFIILKIVYSLGFPGGSDGRASACNEGDLGSIPGSGRSPGEGNGNPLQYSCLENSMGRGAL